MDDEPQIGGATRRPTMKDVAARAGVGLSTVSRVVAGGAGVTPAKVKSVEKAIRELGFSRNNFARTLRTGSADAIGVVVREISDPFFSTLTAAVDAEAQARDLLLLIASGTDNPREAVRVLHRLIRRRLGGLIVTPPDGADLRFLESELAAGTPIVIVDSPAPELRVDTVLVDNRGGMADAAAALVAAGHRRIACLAHTAGVYTSLERRAGFREAVRGHGLEWSEDDIRVVADNDVASSAGALRALAALPDPPTAIVATNGRVTRAVATARGATGFRGAIVGFDDFDLAELLVPPVSTVAQDPHALGRAAARLLFERLAGETGPARTIQLKTRLIVRGDLGAGLS